MVQVERAAAAAELLPSKSDWSMSVVWRVIVGRAEERAAERAAVLCAEDVAADGDGAVGAAVDGDGAAVAAVADLAAVDLHVLVSMELAPVPVALLPSKVLSTSVRSLLSEPMAPPLLPELPVKWLPTTKTLERAGGVDGAAADVGAERGGRVVG